MKKESIEILKDEWRKFCNYVVEVNPHYVDSDFNFSNFMDYLDMKEPDPYALD